MARTGLIEARAFHISPDPVSRLVRATLPVASLVVMLGASPVWGGVGLGIAPTYPPFLEVGQTNQAVSLTITNVSNGAEATGTLTLSDIKHTPSCGTDTAPCPPGQEDKDVFLVKGPVTGRAGTACAGKTFNIGTPNATTGEVEFIANGGSVVLQQPSTPGDQCTIDFLVDVLRLPSKDASPIEGLQTAQPTRVTGVASATSVQGTGTGAGLVTASQHIPKRPTPALSPVLLGLVALLLAGFGVARLRCRPTPHPVRADR